MTASASPTRAVSPSPVPPSEAADVKFSALSIRLLLTSYAFVGTCVSRYQL